MVVTNQNIKCKTIDDLLLTLKSAVSEDNKIRCLRDMGITDIHKYVEFMVNLEESIEKKEKRKNELEYILELNKDKGEYLEHATIGFMLGAPLIYLTYEMFKYIIHPVNKDGVAGGVFIAGFFGLLGLGFIWYALENIAEYTEIEEYTKHKIGEINVEELEKELKKIDKSLNKEKEVYRLLKRFIKYFS